MIKRGRGLERNNVFGHLDTVITTNNTTEDLEKNKFIMQTRPCNLDPFHATFFIVKLGVTGVYIIFLIFALKYRLSFLKAVQIDVNT